MSKRSFHIFASFIIFLSLIFTTFPFPALADTLYERHNTGDTDYEDTDTFDYIAQSFTVGLTGANVAHKISYVDLYLEREGTPGNLTVYLSYCDANSWGTKYTISTSEIVDGNSISNAVFQWVRFNITANVFPSTEYAIILGSENTDGTNNIRWRMNGTGADGYDGSYDGTISRSYDRITWGGLGADFLFNVSGNPLDYDTIPEQPSSLSTSDITVDEIRLTWMLGTNASHTLVEYNTVASWYRGWGTQIYNSTGVTYTHTGLTPATTYYYRAWSWNETNKEWNETAATASATTDTNYLPVLSNETPSNQSINQNFDLEWNITILEPDAQPLDWSIQCAGQSNSSNDDTSGSKKLTLTGLNADTKYTVYVNSTDGYGWTNETFIFQTELVDYLLTLTSIFPYTLTAGSTTITATGGVSIDNVTLYYRHSSDNFSTIAYQNYDMFSNDTLRQKVILGNSYAPIDNKLLWKVNITGTHDEFPGACVHAGIVYYNSKDLSGYNGYRNLTARYLNNGTQLWSYEISDDDGGDEGSDSTPTYYDGVLYTTSFYNDTAVIAVYASNGTEKWRTNVENISGTYLSSVLVDSSNNQVLVNVKGRLCAFNLSTGVFKWWDNSTISHSGAVTPSLYNGVVYWSAYKTASAATNDMFATFANNGTRKWSAESDSNVWDIAPVINSAENLVYYTHLQYDGTTRIVIALNMSTGVRVWNGPTVSMEDTPMVCATPALYGGYLYLVRAGYLYKISATAGSQSYKVEFDSTHSDTYSSPIYADGYLYTATRSGTVYCLTAADGSTVWSFDTGDDIFGQPAMSNSILVIPSDDWYLYAFGNLTQYLTTLGWTEYGTDTSYPWSWDFLFNLTEGYGYYEFFVVGANEGAFERPPAIAGTSCYYEGAVPETIQFPITANGDHIGLYAGSPTGQTNNWNYVNDSSVNNGVQPYSATAELYDLYVVANHTSQYGTISNVTLYAEGYNQDMSSASQMRQCLKPYLGSVSYGSYVTLPAGGAQVHDEHTWSTNPKTGVAWTWSDIDSLQVGIAIKDTYASAEGFCYNLKVNVTYTPETNATTQTATNVLKHSAVLNGLTYADTSIVSCGFWYNSSGTAPIFVECSEVPDSGEAYSATITGLTADTNYSFYTWATGSTSGYDTGSTLYFTTATDAPTNFIAAYMNDTSIQLSWTAGDNSTVIVRAAGGYPTNEEDGVKIYNGTSTSFLDTGLTPSTHYYYRAYNYDPFEEEYSYRNATANNWTTPSPPTNVNASTFGSGASLYYNISWTNGTGATHTVIRRSTTTQPLLPTDGTLVVNSSGVPYYNTSYSQPNYFTLFSYNSSTSLYSTGVNVTGVYFVWVNCYNQSNGGNVTGYTIHMSNANGSQTYYATGCTNPHIITSSSCPQGEDIAVVVSCTGYTTTTYSTSITVTTNVYLDVYLAAGGTSYNESYLYSLSVSEDRTSDYGVVTIPISDASIIVKKYIVNVSSYQIISSGYTDSNGLFNVYLIPGEMYKVFLNKSGYVDNVNDYIPAPPNEWGQTEQKVFKMVTIPVTIPETPVEETLWTNITWSISPTTYYFNSSFTIHFNITSSDSKLEWFWAAVYFYNITVANWDLLFFDNQTTSGGGSISYVVPDVEGKYALHCMFKKEGYEEYDFGTEGVRFYFIRESPLTTAVLDIPDLIYLFIMIFLAIAAIAFLVKFGAGTMSGVGGLGVMGFMLALKPDLVVGSPEVSAWYMFAATTVVYLFVLFLSRSKS